jgi:hypothetical protein
VVGAIGGKQAEYREKIKNTPFVALLLVFEEETVFQICDRMVSGMSACENVPAYV